MSGMALRALVLSDAHSNGMGTRNPHPARIYLGVIHSLILAYLSPVRCPAHGRVLVIFYRNLTARYRNAGLFYPDSQGN